MSKTRVNRARCAKVSVIIPCYNQAQFLAQAIESALKQTYKALEVIVVNDGSPDHIEEVMRAYRVDPRVRILNQTNQGLATARNNGVAISRGQYLQFLDADDVIAPDKIALQAAALDENPSLGMVYCDYVESFPEADFVYQVSLREEGFDEKNHFETLWGRMLFPPCVPLVKRKWFDRAGGFNPKYDLCEDLDFWLRLARLKCRVTVIDKPLAEYRKHSVSMTRTASRDRLWQTFAKVQLQNLASLPKKDTKSVTQALTNLNRQLHTRLWNFLTVRKEVATATEQLRIQTQNYTALQEDYRKQAQAYTQLDKRFRIHQKNSATHIRNVEHRLQLAAVDLAAMREAYLQQQNNSIQHAKSLQAAQKAAEDHARALDKELKERTAHYLALREGYDKLEEESRSYADTLQRALKEAAASARTLEKEIESSSDHYKRLQKRYYAHELAAKKEQEALTVAFKTAEAYAKSLEERLHKIEEYRADQISVEGQA